MFELIISIFKNIWIILTTFPINVFVVLGLFGCLIKAIGRFRKRR